MMHSSLHYLTDGAVMTVGFIFTIWLYNWSCWEAIS